MGFVPGGASGQRKEPFGIKLTPHKVIPARFLSLFYLIAHFIVLSPREEFQYTESHWEMPQDWCP